MKKLSIIITIAALGFPVLAQTSKIDRLKTLEAAVQKEVEQKKKERSTADVFPASARASMLAQLRAVVLRGDDAQIEETLNQLLSYFESDEVRDEVDRLLVELPAAEGSNCGCNVHAAAEHIAVAGSFRAASFARMKPGSSRCADVSRCERLRLKSTS